ncbi:MAG: LamG domain-containing protein, partial [Sedimentisphaerales bacterium]
MCRKLIYLISSVFVPVLILTSTAIAADPSLVGFWKFEEASGTLFDQSDNHNDGTPFNGVLYQQAGQVDYALGFDGADDYIVVGITGRPTDTFSFGGWFKTPATHEIDPQNTTSTGGVNNQRYAFDPQHGGDANAGAGLSLGTNGIVVYEHGSNYMPATAVYETELGDDWNHIMIVYDNKQPTIYLNGRAVHTGLSSPRAIVNSPIQFGGMAYGYFEGLMDEVCIYNRVLSAPEIRKLAARPKAWNPDPPSGAMYPDTWLSLSWSAGYFAASHDVYLGDNFSDVNDGAGDTFRGNQAAEYYVAGFPGFAYPDGLVPGTTYYWRIDEVNDAEPNSPWKGDVWSFSIPPKTSYSPIPADGAEFVELNMKLNWTAGFGTKLHYIVFGEDFDEVNNAAMGTPHGSTTYNPGPLNLAKTYYWRVDEFDGAATHKGDIWSFTTLGAASGPNPANGAVDVKPSVVLRWDAGSVAASHEVYFGADADAVKNATTASPEYKGPKALGEESYDPGTLMLNTAYYWRIDEVNGASTDSPWAGNVWSFTTGDFFVIDDFEDYDAGDNQIWYSWHDGLGYGTPGTADYFAGNGTGASVGDETTASYAEETIVHGGSKSMPLSYDNNKQGYAKYSETELKLTAPRDWTEEGVTELSIWFRGYPGSVGSFVEGPAGTYTMTASGADIWNVNGVEADEFHFAYKMLTGAGSIIARVDSVQNTNDWAKAGVMIRETLDADSAHAFACVTP